MVIRTQVSMATHHGHHLEVALWQGRLGLVRGQVKRSEVLDEAEEAKHIVHAYTLAASGSHGSTRVGRGHDTWMSMAWKKAIHCKCRLRMHACRPHKMFISMPRRAPRIRSLTTYLDCMPHPMCKQPLCPPHMAACKGCLAEISLHPCCHFRAIANP